MAGDYLFWLGADSDRARPSETGSREPSPSVSAASGFDPARKCTTCKGRGKLPTSGFGYAYWTRCIWCHGTGFACDACDPA